MVANTNRYKTEASNFQSSQTQLFQTVQLVGEIDGMVTYANLLNRQISKKLRNKTPQALYVPHALSEPITKHQYSLGLGSARMDQREQQKMSNLSGC